MKSLPVLDGAHKRTGVVEALLGSGIKPGIAPAHLLHMQVAPLQIGPVDVGDLKLASRRGLDRLGNRHDIGIIEIEPGHSPVRFGLERFFLDVDGASARRIERHHAITLGIQHVIGKNRCPLGAERGPAAEFRKAMAMKDIVAKHQCGW